METICLGILMLYGSYSCLPSIIIYPKRGNWLWFTALLFLGLSSKKISFFFFYISLAGKANPL